MNLTPDEAKTVRGYFCNALFYFDKIKNEIGTKLNEYEKGLDFTEDGLNYMRNLCILGGYISLGGPVTFKNAKTPKEVAVDVPLDKLMIETDCPYLAPHPNRGKRNEPSYVRLVLNEIATLREISVDELEEVLDQNSIKFFKLD
jgi:TatD family hydrolase